MQFPYIFFRILQAPSQKLYSMFSTLCKFTIYNQRFWKEKQVSSGCLFQGYINKAIPPLIHSSLIRFIHFTIESLTFFAMRGGGGGWRSRRSSILGWFFYCLKTISKSSGSPKTNFVFTPNFRHASYCELFHAKDRLYRLRYLSQ